PITVHGDGSQERTMTYMDDVIDGSVAPLAHRDVSLGQIFNISINERITALGMAAQIKELSNSSSPIVFVPQRKNNTQIENIDTTKAKRVLGWEARVSFAEGLQKTLAWMRAIPSDAPRL
ncbi:MAG: GDP-mannose 4,6-dehydratase, partial [Patescibacteria group bacterium]|nr:GDP-mannose 4,6-dehydratase [Patescibacteria group bacterium]